MAVGAFDLVRIRFKLSRRSSDIDTLGSTVGAVIGRFSALVSSFLPLLP